MKTILKFKLPEESSEFECANKGSAMAAALHDFKQWLREQQKYQGRETLDIDEVRDKLNELLEFEGITGESIIWR
jgi:hypothetical protein